MGDGLGSLQLRTKPGGAGVPDEASKKAHAAMPRSLTNRTSFRSTPTPRGASDPRVAGENQEQETWRPGITSTPQVKDAVIGGRHGMIGFQEPEVERPIL